MRWVQPTTATRTTSQIKYVLRGDIGHLARAELAQELRRLDMQEAWVTRLDAQEEPIAAGRLEARHVEHRVIWLGMAVQHQKADEQRQRREQHRHLKGYGDKCRPAVQRTPTDVNGQR